MDKRIEKKSGQLIAGFRLYSDISRKISKKANGISMMFKELQNLEELSEGRKEAVEHGDREAMIDVMTWSNAANKLMKAIDDGVDELNKLQHDLSHVFDSEDEEDEEDILGKLLNVLFRNM